MGDKKPIFVLGVGAQKAGTTTLHSVLNKIPGANFGEYKEYHYWTTALGKNQGENLGKFWSEQQKEFHHWLVTDEEAYCRYFSNIIERGARITGDITPAYASLTQQDFSRIKETIHAMGFQIRVIFIVRDPVERCWSAQKMALRRSTSAGLPSPSPEEIYARFPAWYKRDGVVARTRYDVTIKALKKTFNTHELYVGVFEELRIENQFEGLGKFLNLPENVLPKIYPVKNKTKKLALPEQLQRECKYFYQEVYSFCYREIEKTKRLWT